MCGSTDIDCTTKGAININPVFIPASCFKVYTKMERCGLIQANLLLYNFDNHLVAFMLNIIRTRV